MVDKSDVEEVLEARYDYIYSHRTIFDPEPDEIDHSAIPTFWKPCNDPITQPMAEIPPMIGLSNASRALFDILIELKNHPCEHP